MIKLQVDVEVIASKNSIIESIDFPIANPIGYGASYDKTTEEDKKKANIELLDELRQPFHGANPFLMDVSNLDYGDVYWDKDKKYYGYISQVCSDNCGELNNNAVEGELDTDNSFQFTVHGIKLDSLVIMFDLYAKQWATKLIVNDVEFINDGAQFLWRAELNRGANNKPHSSESLNKIVVKIVEWNTPNYPVRITGLFTNLTMSFNNDCIKDLVRGSQCVTDNKKPKYGAISQYGSIVFYDVYNEFAELAEMGLLQSDMKTDIWLMQNDDRNTKIQIGNYISDNWSYDFSNREVTVSLIDRVVKWEAHDYYYLPESDPNILNEINTKDIFLIKLFDNMIGMSQDERFKCINRMVASENDSTINNELYLQEFLDSNIGALLRLIKMEHLNIPVCSYRDAWRFLCEFIGVYAYCDEVGDFTFISL